MDYLIGRLYQWLGVPPLVAKLKRQMIQGKEIEIRTSRHYTVLVLDGLELFFNRENGKYDGWASQVAVEGDDKTIVPSDIAEKVKELRYGC
jgi:hypothetical protein